MARRAPSIGWRRLARACETIGAVAFVCFFISRLGLFFYYIWDRPLEARLSLGWTEPLGWGRYGSTREAANLASLFLWNAIAFGVILVGQFVRVYKLGEHVFSDKTQRFPRFAYRTNKNAVPHGAHHNSSVVTPSMS